MKSKIYNILKWLSQVFLPVIVTLYVAIASIWGLPNTEYIVATITAIDTFLGSILMFNSQKIESSVIDEPILLTKEIDEELKNGKGDNLNE